MDDPAGEIEKVAVLLMAAVNPEIQKAAVLKYYTPDVSFRHPFCTVPSAPNSREALLAILQWYRVLSPKLVVHMRSATFDRDTNDLYLDAEQDFHIRWSPFRAAPSRLLIHLKLRPIQDPSEGTTLYQIASQEDFYHPEDLAALLMPPLMPLVHLFLRAGALISGVNARMFGLLGCWSVKDEGGKRATPEPREEPVPDDVHPEGEGDEGGAEDEGVELTEMHMPGGDEEELMSDKKND